MSRIGRAPIAIPAGVEIKIEENNVVTVKGPKGTLTRQFHPNMTIAQEGAELKVTHPNDAKENRALHGLTRTLLHNMIVGVTDGYKKELEVNGDPAGPGGQVRCRRPRFWRRCFRPGWRYPPRPVPRPAAAER